MLNNIIILFNTIRLPATIYARYIHRQSRHCRRYNTDTGRCFQRASSHNFRPSHRPIAPPVTCPACHALRRLTDRLRFAAPAICNAHARRRYRSQFITPQITQPATQIRSARHALRSHTGSSRQSSPFNQHHYQSHVLHYYPPPLPPRSLSAHATLRLPQAIAFAIRHYFIIAA